jgi:hypothetical protein
MLRTYEAILEGNTIAWAQEDPQLLHPVRVHVTLIEPTATPEGRGQRMADVLDKLASAEAFLGIEDPVEWQKAVREDRPLPFRSK